MIAQIGPLVQGGRPIRLVGSHLIGGLLGGLSMGALVGFVGMILHLMVIWPPELSAGLLSVVLLLVAARDASLLPLPRIGLVRQTPGAWKCSFGPAFGILAWGFDLGCGLTTRLTTYALLVLPIFAVLSGDMAMVIVAFGVFGAARAATVIAVGLAADVASPEASHELGARQGVLLRLAAAGSVAAASALLITWT